MQIEKFESQSDQWYQGDWRSYGFMVYNRSGYSLPKGMITSFQAHQFSGKIQIEFSVQSPSGDHPDSSDHHNYGIPAIKSFAQGKQIVDMYAQMVESWITEESKTESI